MEKRLSLNFHPQTVWNFENIPDVASVSEMENNGMSDEMNTARASAKVHVVLLPRNHCSGHETLHCI